MIRWQRALAPVAGAMMVLGLPFAGLVSAEEGLDARKKALEGAVAARSSGNQKAGEAQGRIDALSDEADSLTAQYRTALKQMESVRVYNEQMEKLMASQGRELTSLDSQLERVDSVGRSVTPLMLRMIDTLARFVELDMPFLAEERTERVEELRRTMERADVTTPEKFRQIMEAYQIENEYGRTIEAYRGTIEIEGRETTVDFLRFGRIVLVYQSLDQTNSGVWDRNAGRWEPLDSGYRSGIRDGLRIARKQSAPDLIRLPLPAAAPPRGTS